MLLQAYFSLIYIRAILVPEWILGLIPVLIRPNSPYINMLDELIIRRWLFMRFWQFDESAQVLVHSAQLLVHSSSSGSSGDTSGDTHLASYMAILLV